MDFCSYIKSTSFDLKWSWKITFPMITMSLSVAFRPNMTQGFSPPSFGLIILLKHWISESVSTDLLCSFSFCLGGQFCLTQRLHYSCVYLLALWGTIRAALILNVLMCVKTFTAKIYINKSSTEQHPLTQNSIRNSVFFMLYICSLVIICNNKLKRVFLISAFM